MQCAGSETQLIAHAAAEIKNHANGTGHILVAEGNNALGDLIFQNRERAFLEPIHRDAGVIRNVNGNKNQVGTRPNQWRRCINVTASAYRPNLYNLRKDLIGREQL